MTTYECNACGEERTVEGFGLVSQGSTKGDRNKTCLACKARQQDWMTAKQSAVNSVSEWSMHGLYPDHLFSKSGLCVNVKTRKVIGKFNKGYIQATLHVNGKQIMRRVHDLMWESWIGPIPEGLVVDHKNGCKSDNRLDNLRCITQGDNLRASYRAGTSTRAPRVAHPLVAISPDGTETRYKSYYSAGRALGIVASSVRLVCLQKTNTATASDKQIYRFRFA